MATGTLTSKEMSFTSLEVMKQHFFFFGEATRFGELPEKAESLVHIFRNETKQIYKHPFEMVREGGPGEISKKRQSE